MPGFADRLGWAVFIGRTLLLGLLGLSVSGCQTARYYQQAISGQLEIWRQRQPVSELLSDPDTHPDLKQKFELVNRLREFADAELRLPINSDYTSYVDLRRRFVVWNVHAAPPYSSEPKKWWYPFVGSLKYRGFFAEPDARQYAANLEREGYDVYVEGVEAYSTLGWFADPLLNTFMHYPEPGLAEIIFHELAHQRLFVPGDTDFNEAFATALAEEGVRRWFLGKQDQAGYRDYLAELNRNRQFVGLVLNARRQLQDLYQENADGSPKVRRVKVKGPAPAWMQEEKTRILEQLRAEYQAVKISWGGSAAYDGWFARPLNNAQLNTIAVYYELVPGFQALLRKQHGDLEGFYKAVRDLRRLRKEDRQQRLRALGDG